MTVAVIGGTRHIGPAIIQCLVEAGHSVSVFNRGRTPTVLPSGVRRVTVDRKVPGQLAEALRANQPETVIDLIAYEAAEVQEVIKALPSLRHYVFCGSTAVYGRIGQRTPNELTPMRPDSQYTFGKVACEQVLQNQDGFPFTVLRLAHPYGPGDHLLYVAGREALFLDRMRHGRPILIPGDGKTRIHAIYVQDVARAFVHVIGRPQCMGRIYNLAGDQILSLDEYFASIARVLGVPIVVRKLPGEFFKERAHLWASWRRKFDFGFNWIRYESAFDTAALRETGFRCDTNHDAGVAKTLEWLDSNKLIPTSSNVDEEDQILVQV